MELQAVRHIIPLKEGGRDVPRAADARVQLCDTETEPGPSNTAAFPWALGSITRETYAGAPSDTSSLAKHKHQVSLVQHRDTI